MLSASKLVVGAWRIGSQERDSARGGVSDGESGRAVVNYLCLVYIYLRVVLYSIACVSPLSCTFFKRFFFLRVRCCLDVWRLSRQRSRGRGRYTSFFSQLRSLSPHTRAPILSSLVYVVLPRLSRGQDRPYAYPQAQLQRSKAATSALSIRGPAVSNVA